MHSSVVTTVTSVIKERQIEIRKMYERGADLWGSDV